MTISRGFGRRNFDLVLFKTTMVVLLFFCVSVSLLQQGMDIRQLKESDVAPFIDPSSCPRCYIGVIGTSALDLSEC